MLHNEFKKATTSLTPSAIYALRLIAKNCPTEDKIELFATIDCPNIIGQAYKAANNFGITYFMTEAFKDIDLETSLRMLKFSEAWINVPKTQSLRDNLIHYDGQHLIPALDYSNNDPSPTHNIG